MTYTTAQQSQLATELDQATAEGAFWPTAVVDYERLRDMVRACKSVS